MKRQDKIFFKLALATENKLTFIGETAAKKNSKEKKLFSSADLWNIRRRKRITLIR